MPANLTQPYLEADKRFKEAKTLEEKISALEEMLKLIPKHKGTEKLQADIKSKLAKFRKEESQKKKSTSRQGALYNIEKEGAGQIALVGLPNVGKSSLVSILTNANPEVADYPGSTLKPTPGMMTFEDIQIQLIDLPPIMNEATDSWVYSIIRNADTLWIVLDLQDDPLGQLEIIIEELKNNNIGLYTMLGSPYNERFYNMKNIVVVANKCDDEESGKNFVILQKKFAEIFYMEAVSVILEKGFNELKKKTFESLNIVRIYSKVPGKEPDLKNPFIIKKGTNLIEFAGYIHKDFVQKFKYARIWGKGKFEGQRVSKDYIVQDMDIIELHV